MAGNIVEKRVDGVRFPLCYNASQISLESILPRLKISSSVRSVAQTNRCKYALSFLESGNVIYYFSPRKAVSFAVQIEHWVKDKKDLKDRSFVFAVIMDDSIYFADVDNGLVVSGKEEILIFDKAKERLDKIENSGTPLRIFTLGKKTKNIDFIDADLATPSPVKISNVDYATFKWMPLLFTKKGLFHPLQAIVVASLLAVFGGSFTVYQNYQEEILRIALEKQRQLVAERQRLAKVEEKKGDVPFGASSAILDFIDAFDTAKFLRTVYGLNHFSWESVGIITFEGEYIRNIGDLFNFSAKNKWKFDVKEGNSWSMSYTTLSGLEMAEESNFDEQSLLDEFNFFDKEFTLGHSEFRGPLEGNLYEFSFLLPFVDKKILEDIAGFFKGKAYELNSVDCQFELVLIKDCSFSLTAYFE